MKKKCTLSEVELAIIQLSAEEFTNDQIADRLHMVKMPCATSAKKFANGPTSIPALVPTAKPCYRAGYPCNKHY